MKRIFLGLALLCTLTLSCREKPYENPVIANDCPDPSVLDNRSRDGYFYAYSTRSRIGDTLYYQGSAAGAVVVQLHDQRGTRPGV